MTPEDTRRAREAASLTDAPERPRASCQHSDPAAHLKGRPEHPASAWHLGYDCGMSHFRVFLILLALPGLTHAQSPTQPKSAPTWAYSKKDDPLRGISLDQFVLDGKYLTPPSPFTKDPTLVVQCSNGKLKAAYLDAGAVVQRGSYQNALKGTLAHVDIRFDEKNQP